MNRRSGWMLVLAVSLVSHLGCAALHQHGRHGHCQPSGHVHGNAGGQACGHACAPPAATHGGGMSGAVGGHGQGCGCRLCANTWQRGGLDYQQYLNHQAYRYQGAGSGVPSAAVAYPYYTTRGPRDFLVNNPPTIGR